MRKGLIISIITTMLLTVGLNAGSSDASAQGKLYNTAYFDIAFKAQDPMLDYIKYSKRGSFELKQFFGTVTKIEERRVKVKVHGRIEVPKDITTNKVYINAGSKYSFSYGSGNDKYIFYNNNKIHQNAEYFLVNTKKDKFGNRYIDYTINMSFEQPWRAQSDKDYANCAPKEIIFKVAPKTRGFKNKFQKAEIYVLDE